MSDPHEDRVTAQLRERLAELYGREPRWRYFQRDGGPMFAWTVEPFGSGGLFDTPNPRRVGRYASTPTSPSGAARARARQPRSGWPKNSESLHDLRRDAKARALRLFRAWQAGERRPWR